MKKRIYWSMCRMALMAVVLSSLITAVVYYNRIEKQMKQEVVREARYLEAGLELSGSEYLELLFQKTGRSVKNRITLIDSDGFVLFDNYAANDSMENHRNRPEVKSALETGIGESTRVSDTLSENTYYYAIRLSNGSVIRAANTTRSAMASLWSLIPMIGLTSVVILVLSMMLADKQTRKIVQPINNIDLDHPNQNRVYDELAPFIGRIERQQETIRRQMEILEAKQKEFTTITENMNEGFIVVGKKAEVVSYNTSALKILGIDDPHAGEQGINILNLNRSHIFRKAVDEALKGSHNEQGMELNGRYYQVIANPVTENGEVSGAIIVIFDVTEKQEREGLRREFSANVSHELKTPLTSISGYAEIMKNGLVKPEDMKHFSENIYHEAQRMITLIGDIIKLSQLDENQVDLGKTTVDLYHLAEDVVNRLQDSAKTAGISLKLEGGPAAILGTTQILEEMLYNLCDNGIKYNKPGGSVTVKVSAAEGHPVITVADTGIGIPEADQDRVFERFYRVDKSHSNQIGGTGLGLSIVKHGAIYHNARIEIESKEGRGTTVRIIF